jgi:hypothetical protein
MTAPTLSRRIVAAHEMAVPVMAIVGGREMRDGPGETARLADRQTDAIDPARRSRFSPAIIEAGQQTATERSVSFS